MTCMGVGWGVEYREDVRSQLASASKNTCIYILALYCSLSSNSNVDLNNLCVYSEHSELFTAGHADLATLGRWLYCRGTPQCIDTIHVS